MKAKLVVMLLAIATMGLTLPCQDDGNLQGMEFDEFVFSSFRELTSGFGDHGVISVRATSGNCFDVIPVDQTIHNDVFGERAITADEEMIVEFKGQDNWGVVIYVGSDTFDAERQPEMQCFAKDENGGPDIYIGGDIAGTPFGPEELIEDPAEFGPFQYLVYFPGRRPFLNYVPRPIAYCTVDPDGEDVFIGLVQADPATGNTAAVKTRRR